MNALTVNGKQLTIDNVEILGFEEPVKYKRFMWRFDGTEGTNSFQLSRIKVNDEELPYVYVIHGANFSNFSNTQTPQNMLKSDSYVGGNDESWGGYANRSTGYGWIIFDISNLITPVKYKLMTAGDTASYPGRNPKRIRLYASTETPTTADDASWVLLDDRSDALPAANHVWTEFVLNQV